MMALCMCTMCSRCIVHTLFHYFMQYCEMNVHTIHLAIFMYLLEDEWQLHINVYVIQM